MANEKMLEDLESAKLKALLDDHRRQLTVRERELLQERDKLQQELLLREKKLQQEKEEREKLFEQRERRLHEQQFKFEHEIAKRQQENASLRERLQAEIAQRESQLAEAERLLALEKARYTEESRNRLEAKSKDYVKDALDALQKNEDHFRLYAQVWAVAGALSLVGGVVLFGWVTVDTFGALPAVLSWPFVALTAFKGLVGLALFAALSKYAYLFSNSSMSESLKNSNRRHAINFGKFYLETYGTAADWAQVKEAFEHWNIDGPNGFAPVGDGAFDLTALEKTAAAIEKLRKVLPVPGFKD